MKPFTVVWLPRALDRLTEELDRMVTVLDVRLDQPASGADTATDS